MPRSRTNSQVESLFVGPTPATGGQFISAGNKVLTDGPATSTLITEILRLQDYNYGFNQDLQPVSQFGDFAPIDYVNINPPSVTLSFSYLLANMTNEKALGFTLSQGTLNGALSGILTKTSDDKNYFISTSQEGFDYHTNGPVTITSTAAIGNGFVTNYSVNAAVGQIPTVSVDVEGSNFRIDNTYSGLNPSINTALGTELTSNFYRLPTGSQTQTNVSGFVTNSNLFSISTTRPGDVTFSAVYTDLGPVLTDAKIQSVQLSVPLQRDPISQLGARFALSREITPPVNATLTLNALLGDTATGSLYGLVSSCIGGSYSAQLDFASPCNSTQKVASYIFRGAKLDSHAYSSSVGGNKSVTMVFNIPVGGPSVTGTNLYFSGIAAN